MEYKKEDDGFSIHVSNNEVKMAGKTLGILGAGLVVIRLVRFLVWK